MENIQDSYVDEVFVSQLGDRLTLLVCRRQGIKISELLPIETVSIVGIVDSLGEMRWRQFEARRQSKIKLVDDERKELISQLKILHQSGESNGKLFTELLLQCADSHGIHHEKVEPVHVESFSHFIDPDEGELVKSLLHRHINSLHDKLLPQALVSAASPLKIAEAAAKYQQIELRQVNKGMLSLDNKL